MERHNAPDQALAHSIGCLMNVLQLSVDVLVLDLEGLGEVLTVVVDRSELQAPAFEQRAVDTNGVEGARELVPVGALEQEVGKREMLVEPLQDNEVLLDLLLRVLLRGVTGVGLKNGSPLG
jgi:hypothetical protein